MRSLIDPVWLLLTVLVVAVSTKFNSAKINRVIQLIARASMAILVFLSTGVATLIFDKILATESTPQTGWSPEFIFVLGGGYELAATEAQDFLGTESIRRVNAASALWTKYPKAKVVFLVNNLTPKLNARQLDTANFHLSTQYLLALLSHGLSSNLLQKIPASTRLRH